MWVFLAGKTTPAPNDGEVLSCFDFGAKVTNTTSTSATTSDEIITAALLVIGDEILSGRTKDKNIGFIADYLSAIGIRLTEVRIVADEEDDIIAAVRALKSRYSYLFTTGGIGPTHDDITAESVAKALGVAIDVDDRALALMKPYYDRRGLELTPSRLRMARIPKGARLIENKISIAPGFMIDNVVVMAGVPDIMQVMLDDAAQYLKTGRRMNSASLLLDHPEGEIADLFTAHQAKFPDVAMGSYPTFRDGTIRCELVLRSVDAEQIEIALTSLREKLKAAGKLS